MSKKENNEKIFPRNFISAYKTINIVSWLFLHLGASLEREKTISGVISKITNKICYIRQRKHNR